MSNYVKITDFAIKDSLPTGNPAKVASGTQIDTEYEAIEVAIATKEDTANKAQNNGYASLDGSGDVPDTQIPATIPRLSLDNIFTGTQTISNTAPTLIYKDTDAATNEKNWLFRAAGNLFFISTATDAAPGAGVANAVLITRSGTTVTSVNFSATNVQVNGNNVFHTGNDGSGSGLDADLLDGNNSTAFATATHNHSATEITSGSMADARIQLSNVTQHQASLTTRNLTGRTGIAKTISTSAASGGADGDIWYRY